MGLLNRRRFLKYAGAATVAGAAAVGGATYYLSEKRGLLETVARTSTSASETTPTYGPPQIAGLAYTPTRVLNSKIYDIRVDVEIADPAKRLSSVIVTLEPAAYAQLPSDAFPQEERRTALLQSSGQAKPTLSAVFSDLKGGREYDLRAGAADSSGLVAEKTSRTEYIREFENIAPLDDTIAIADYYTWYGIPDGSWTDDQGRSEHVYTPLLGQYDSADPIVISKHIDWATGYGIDAFSVSWWGSDYTQTEKFEDGFLKHPMADQMKFFILYENNGRLKIQNPNDSSDKWIEDLDDPFNRNTLVSDFELLAENCFARPNYLKINSKPAVRFDYTTCFRGDVADVFTEIREALKRKGFEIYLINDLMGRGASPYAGISESHFREIAQTFDAIGASGFSDQYDDIAKDAHFVESVYHAWRDYAEKYGKGFIPGVCPGHHGSPPWYVPPSYVPWRRSPERLGRQIRLAKEYGTLKTLSVISFNEWYLGHQVEPSKEEGFSYLQVIRDSLAGH